LFIDFTPTTQPPRAMRVLVADKFPKEEFTDTDFNWCEEDELLMVSFVKSTKQNPRLTLVGTKSLKHTTRWKAKEVKGMDEDLLLDLIIEAHERSGLYQADDFIGKGLYSTDEVLKETLSVFNHQEQ